MSMDYVVVGESPVEEDCVQVGSDNYMVEARKECKRFIELIRKIHGNEPEGAKLAIKSFSHDFGDYLEVVCYFEEDNEEACNYAYNVENNLPMTWDDEQQTA